jgi:hypothetical protein
MGALPWLAANVTSGFPSLGQPASHVPTTFGQRLSDCFTLAVPRLLGLRDVRGSGWLLGPVGIAAFAALLVVFAVVVRRWPRRLELVLAVLVPFPLLYAFPSSTAISHPRYALFAGPFVALLAGAGLQRLFRASPVPLAGVLVALATVTAVGLVGLAHDGDGEPDVVPPDHRPVLAALDRLGIDRAYTDHWIGYRLTFETDERILTDPIPSTRWADYDRAVARAERVAWIIPAGGPLDRQFEALTAARGAHAQRIDAGAYAVWTTDARLTPEDLGLDP